MHTTRNLPPRRFAPTGSWHTYLPEALPLLAPSWDDPEEDLAAAMPQPMPSWAGEAP